VALDTGIGAGDVWPERPVNSLDGSVDTFAAAETQPGGPAPPFHAAMTCYGGSRSAQRPLWNRYPEEIPVHQRAGVARGVARGSGTLLAASERRLFHDL
jgi:hypothetical protein